MSNDCDFLMPKVGHEGIEYLSEFVIAERKPKYGLHGRKSWVKFLCKQLLKMLEMKCLFFGKRCEMLLW